jgi:transposase
MVCRNVRRCRTGDHIERWVGSGLLVAERQFESPGLLGDSVSDPEDARRLARLAHVGPELLSPIQRRSAKTQSGLALVLAREVAVETRTKIVNAVRGIVKSSGHRLPTSATSSFARKAQGGLSGGVEADVAALAVRGRGSDPGG